MAEGDDFHEVEKKLFDLQSGEEESNAKQSHFYEMGDPVEIQVSKIDAFLSTLLSINQKGLPNGLTIAVLQPLPWFETKQTNLIERLKMKKTEYVTLKAFEEAPENKVAIQEYKRLRSISEGNNAHKANELAELFKEVKSFITACNAHKRLNRAESSRGTSE